MANFGLILVLDLIFLIYPVVCEYFSVFFFLYNFVCVWDFVMINFSYDADGYDPMDPMGNITIRWDVTTSTENNHHVSFPFRYN